MFLTNLLKSGWLHALFIAMIAYPAGDIVQRFVASSPNSNILVFTSLFMISASLALLIISGPGKLAIKTLKLPETWIYSFLQIIVLILGLLVFKYISATEGSTLFRIEVSLTLILSWLFLNQQVNKYEMFGAGLILLGFYLIISNSDISLGEKALVVILIISRSLSQSVQKIITELHKTNRKANSFKDSLRVTGFIMAVASLVFLIFLLTIAGFKHYNDEVGIFRSFPMFSDFADKTVCLSACILVFFILSFSKYCEFYAGKTIGAKYLTSILSFYIIIVMLIEKTLGIFGLIEEVSLAVNHYIALTVVVIGSLLISLSGFIKDFKFIKKGEKQDTLANLEENFIEEESDFKLLKLNLSNLITLYDKDSKKLATDLNLDRVTLDNILNYDFDEVKVNHKTEKKINDFASQKVGNTDKLTKAFNRYYLEHKVDELFSNDKPFKLYYLDLNKFKPINDKHGHEVGDIVLKKIVRKLNKLEEFSGNVFRVGGDEFILLQTATLEQDLSQLIKDTIELPIAHEGMSFEISTSSGYVLSENYSSLDEMIKDADKLMFKNKEENGTDR